MKQPLILCIETATKTCSACLAAGNEILAIRESFGTYSHAENLAPFIQQVLQEAGMVPSQVNAVAVSKGPGSYTGLRIGVSLAKGFCYGTGARLIGIETLASMATLAAAKFNDGLLVPMIDARRMEVYTATFSSTGDQLQETHAQILDENTFTDLLNTQKVYFFGDGAEKCRPLIQHPNAVFPGEEFCSSRGLAAPAQFRYKQEDFENAASFEPYYLKDFQAGRGSV